MREELEWPLVDILQARLGYYSEEESGLSPVSAGERGEKGGGGGGVMLKSLPGNASTSTIEKGKT